MPYNDKITFQNILFPEELRFSLKNKECRTPKSNLMLELTNFFSDAYSSKKQKTQKLKAFESRLVARSENLSNQLIIELKQFVLISD